MVYMSSRYYSATFLGFLFMVLTLLLQIQPLEATSKSPYDSGYDHGYEDADISDPNNRYINQPKRGPSFHTHEFMRGYNACSGGSPNGDSYNDGYEKGYEDGLDHPIDREIRDGDSEHGQQYREGYLDGFMDGCIDVEGNDRDIAILQWIGRITE